MACVDVSVCRQTESVVYIMCGWNQPTLLNSYNGWNHIMVQPRSDICFPSITDSTNPCFYPGVAGASTMQKNIIPAYMLGPCIAGHQQAWYWSHHFSISLIAMFMGPTWAHLGPTGPRWAPCWPHELCYLGLFSWRWISHTCSISMSRNNINTHLYWCLLKSIKYKVGTNLMC